MVLSKELMIAGGTVAAVLLALVGLKTLEINDLRGQLSARVVEISDLKSAVAARDAALAALNETKIDGEEIARVAARACQSAVKFQIKAQAEAVEIRNAPDDDAAARAYDAVLCRRPEAAGHPACSAGE